MGGMMGGGGSAAMPELQDPPPMPDTEGPEAREARRKRMAEAMQRGGRASTIITSDTTRPSDYSRTTLGGR